MLPRRPHCLARAAPQSSRVVPGRPGLCAQPFRLLLSTLRGASLFLAHRKQSSAGALVGGTVALLSTYASYRLHSTLSEKAHLPHHLRP